MRTHQLKCWPVYFEAVLSGEKTFEVRRDDRGFCGGDILWLREWDPTPIGNGYTGRELRLQVTYLLRGPTLGVESDWVVMAIGTPTHGPAAYCCTCGTAMHAEDVHCTDCWDDLLEDERSQDGSGDDPIIKIVAGRDVPWRDVFAAARRELERADVDALKAPSDPRHRPPPREE